MPLKSFLLSGNARLEQAAAGPPSIKRRPPDDDADAIKSIQLALVELGYPLPISFQSGGPDGVFGDETYNAVVRYQQRSFPGQPGEWDGRIGPNTLAKMDSDLPQREPNEHIAENRIHIRSHCLQQEPEGETTTVASTGSSTLPNRRVSTAGGLPGRTA